MIRNAYLGVNAVPDALSICFVILLSDLRVISGSLPPGHV